MIKYGLYYCLQEKFNYFVKIKIILINKIMLFYVFSKETKKPIFSLIKLNEKEKQSHCLSIALHKVEIQVTIN